MNIQAKLDSALIVRSFAYVAKQLARSGQYGNIPSEAEKHLGALRMVQRDVFDMTGQGLRERTLTRAQFQRLRDAAVQATTQGQQAITRVAAQYVPHRLAA